MRLFRSMAALLIAFFAVAPSAAQHGPLGHYTARLSSQDHFNSNGERLRTVAAIIRQDRANVYRFGRPDPEDEEDDFFDDPANRAALERIIARSRISRSVSNAILNGQPLIHVDVFRGYIVISLL